MKIKKITSQHRRDFTAIYECEHCGAEWESDGYDDAHFHENVIPEMICDKCNRTSDESYRPLMPKYSEGRQV